MRFTSVGPKWRAALRSSLSRRVCLSLFLRAACSLSLPALSDAATIPLPPAVLNPSSLPPPSLSLSGPRDVAQTAGMHQMHRALTDARPRSIASTCLLRPFASLPLSLPAPLRERSLSLSLSLALSLSRSRSRCPSLALLILLRSFVSFFFSRATPPPRTTLASFTSFCRRRHCCHSREWPASLYHRVMVHFFLLHALAVRSYVRTHTHTHTQARGLAERRSTLCRRRRRRRCCRECVHRVVHRDALSRALPPRFLFLSFRRGEVSSAWPSSLLCPSIALPFTPRSLDDSCRVRTRLEPLVSVIDQRC